jgi:hypothetical protein
LDDTSLWIVLNYLEVTLAKETWMI